MKKALLLVLICIFFISGCAINTDVQNNNKINELEERIKMLETELEEKNNYVTWMQEKENLFPAFSNISIEFVRGQTQGDVQKLKEVVADNVLIIEDNDKIYGTYESNGIEIEYMLYDGSSDVIYKDMIIQGYGYLEENEAYVIHIREFFEYQNGEPVSPPTFLNLYFENFEGSWKITGFDFDV
ncbi:MAG: hypothetical protein JJT76_06600 [Clostridiaceae bacterium]|nr:hypothetical protein [Clostridiaceae bacterium]